MLGFIRPTVIELELVLLGFGRSSAKKFVSMNYEPCIVRQSVIDLKSGELH